MAHSIKTVAAPDGSVRTRNLAARAVAAGTMAILFAVLVLWTALPAHAANHTSSTGGKQPGGTGLQSPWPWIKKELVDQVLTGPGNARNSEGDFIRLKNGDLLHVYTRFIGDSSWDNADACIASRRSADNGRTWTQENKTEVVKGEGLNVMSVSCLRLKSGALALFYLTKVSKDDCRPFMRVSLDEGRTWSEPKECLKEKGYYLLCNGRAVMLEKSRPGRIVLPLSWVDKESRQRLSCLISDDDGETWQHKGEVPNPKNDVHQEPVVCELGDGRLAMFTRTTQNCQCFAFSSDSGETWTEPAPSPLDSPVSPCMVKRIPGRNELVAVWNPMLIFSECEPIRVAMDIAALSPDAGTILVRKTMEFPCDNYRDWQYPYIYFLNEREFLVGYFNWDNGTNVYLLDIADLLEEER